MKSLHIIYASTSGHTEHVIKTLLKLLQSSDSSLAVTTQYAEAAQSEDLLQADVLLLACGTWNTGSVEGQLNPHMHDLLKKRAKETDLQQKLCALIALGDDRYYYTCRAVEHLQQYVKSHNGTMLLSPLLIVNEPYGQEEKMEKWGAKLLESIQAA